MNYTADERERQRRVLAKRYQQHEEPSVARYTQQEDQISHVMAMAERHGIDMPHDIDLTALLATVTPEQQLPPALYQAVASLVIWLQQLEAEQASATKDH